MEDKQGFLVTNRMMYEKLESIENKVTELATKDQLDHGRLKELESTTKWLQRVVYALGLPVVVLLSGFELVTKVWL